MNRFGEFICKYKILILVIAFILVIPSIYGMMQTRVNYDILTYLPDGIETIEGEKILDNEFNMGSFSVVLFISTSFRSGPRFQMKTVYHSQRFLDNFSQGSYTIKDRFRGLTRLIAKQSGVQNNAYHKSVGTKL